MGKKHPFYALTVHCLSDDPNTRPKTSDLVQELERFVSQCPPPFDSSIEMLNVVNNKSKENRNLEVQVQDLKVKERELEAINRDHSTQIEALEVHVSALGQELRDTRALLNMKEKEVESKMEEISTKDSLLEARKMEVESLIVELGLLRHSHPEEVSITLGSLLYTNLSKILLSV